MTRIASLTLPFEADLSKARTAYDEFKRYVETNGIKVPMGAPTSGGATAGTNAPMGGAPVNGTAAGFTPGTPTGTFAGQVVGTPAQPINFSGPTARPTTAPPLQTAGDVAFAQQVSAQTAARSQPLPIIPGQSAATIIAESNRQRAISAQAAEVSGQAAGYRNLFYETIRDQYGGPPTGPSGSGMGLGKYIRRGIAVAGYRAIATDATEYYVNNQRDSIRRAYSSLGDQVNQDVSESQGILQSHPGAAFVGGILNAAGGLLNRLGSKGDSGNRYTDADTTRAALEAKQVYESQQRGDEARIRARDLSGENRLIGSSGLGREYGEANESERREIARIEALRRADKSNQGDVGFLQEEAAVRDRATRTRGNISDRLGEESAQRGYRSIIASAVSANEGYRADSARQQAQQRSEMEQAQRDVKGLPDADAKAYIGGLTKTQADERQAFRDQVVRRTDIQVAEQTGMTAASALDRRGFYEAGGEAAIRAKYGAQLAGLDTSLPGTAALRAALLGAQNEELTGNTLKERRRQVSVTGEISSLQSAYNRDPLGSRLDSINTQRDVDLVGITKPDEIARINRRAELQRKTTIQDYSDDSRNIRNSLDTERGSLTDYLNADSPAAGRRVADLDRMFGAGKGEAMRLVQSGRRDEAAQSLGNTALQFQVYEKDFLNSFRSEQFDFRRMSGTNRRDQEDPGEVLKTISQKLTDVHDAIEKIVSGDQL